MTLDLFVKLKNESSTIILFVGIGYVCVTYFLTSLTMPDPQTSDMRRIRYMMSELPMASARLKKLRILSKRTLRFYSCRSFKHSKWLHKLGHTEYLIQTLYSCSHVVVESDEKSSNNGGF